MPADTSTRPLLLNLGCGSKRHPDWVNVDYSRWDEVKQCWPFRSFLREGPPQHFLNHDLRKGLPFAEDSAAAVYAAQFLEHLDKPAAVPFLEDVRRALQPRGVVRLVVPDLEQIAQYYLNAVAGIRSGVQLAPERHEWAVIWLIDQMVRTKTGGEMEAWVGRHRRSPVIAEIGGEIAAAAAQESSGAAALDPAPPALSLRNRLAQWLRRRYQPRTAADTGELHRWMYDEFSLKAVLEEAGFRDIRRCAHSESRIASWRTYGFDEYPDESPTQPGSLWMEAVK